MPRLNAADPLVENPVLSGRAYARKFRPLGFPNLVKARAVRARIIYRRRVERMLSQRFREKEPRAKIRRVTLRQEINKAMAAFEEILREPLRAEEISRKTILEIRGRICPGCGVRFMSDQHNRVYHTWACGALARQKRYWQRQIAAAERGEVR
jgi:hypothetical protein